MQIRAQLGKHFGNRHFIRFRRIGLDSEIAKLAREHTDIRRFEFAVENEINAVARFRARDGVGMTVLIAEQRLSDQAADTRFTRLRALITRVVGAR